MHRSSRALVLVLLLCLLVPATCAADWQQDLALPGPVTTTLDASPLSPRADGVDVLVLAGGTLRIASLDSGVDGARWSASQDTIGVPVRKAIARGWIRWRSESGFPGSEPCAASLLSRDGRVSALQERTDLSNAACLDAVPMGNGVAVLAGYRYVTRVDQDGVRLWSVVLDDAFFLGYRLLQTADGNLLVAGRHATTGAGRLIRLDGATGQIQAQWMASDPSTSVSVPTLRASAGNGIQALGTNLNQLVALAWDAQLQLVQQQPIVVSFSPSGVFTVATAAGLGACWIEPGPAGASGWLNAIALDQTLQPRWQIRLADATEQSCRMALSAQGRATVMASGGDTSRLLRIRPDGQVVEQPDLADLAYRFDYSGDEQLWVTQRFVFPTVPPRVLQYDRDTLQAAQVTTLAATGELPLLRQMAWANNAVELLVGTSDRVGPLRAFRVSPSGVVIGAEMGNDAEQLRIAATHDGWIFADGSGWRSLAFDGQLRWVRSDLAGQDLICRVDGSCIRLGPMDGSGRRTTVISTDPAGVDSAMAMLPPNEWAVRMSNDGDDLLVISQTSDGGHALHRVQGDGTLLQLARTPAAIRSYVLATSQGQLVLSDSDGLLSGWVGNAATPVWQRPYLPDTLSGDTGSQLWVLPASDGVHTTGLLAPVDRAGQLRWQQPLPFTVSDVRRPADAYGIVPAIVGSATGTSWVAGETHVGRPRVFLASVDGQGQVLRTEAFADALTPVVAIRQDAARQSVAVAYLAAMGDQPVLRIRGFEDALLKNGFEN